jgi:hypothetical protein
MVKEDPRPGAMLVIEKSALWNVEFEVKVRRV